MQAHSEKSNEKDKTSENHIAEGNCSTDPGKVKNDVRVENRLDYIRKQLYSVQP